MPAKAKFSITKLRCNNSRIPTITGRYRYPGKLVDCVHCVMIIELVMNTMFYLNVKMLLFVKWEKIISAYSTQRPSMYKCIEVIQSKDQILMLNLGLFLKNVLPLFH